MSNIRTVKDNYFINSLARGMEILTAFSPARPMLTVSELAERTGLPQSTVFRLVYTLEHLGYLVRDDATRKYQQSMRMLSIGLAARENSNIRSVSSPFVKQLSNQTGESAKLAILDGIEIMMIVVVEASDKLLHRTSVGHRSPVHCTSLGKALLAFQPPEIRDATIDELPFRTYTQNTITNPEVFKAVLDRVVSLGYARSDEEYVLGMSSLAAPIFDDTGQVVAAVNLSGLLTPHLKDAREKLLIQAVMDCARQISTELGFPGSGTVEETIESTTHSSP